MVKKRTEVVGVSFLRDGGLWNELAVHFFLFEVTGVAEFSRIRLFTKGNDSGVKMERVAWTVERVCIVVVQIEQLWSDGKEVVVAGKYLFATAVYPVGGISR